MNNLEIGDFHGIVCPDEEKLDKEKIGELVIDYLSSKWLKLLNFYHQYYMGENTVQRVRVEDREIRGKTPNNFVPTPYYATLVDTLAGYMFQNVQYEPKTESDKTYAEKLNEILNNNNYDVKEMQTGIRALTYNQGVEMVYTQGDDKEIKYSTFDPRQFIFIFDNKIEPEIFCAIRVFHSSVKDYDYYIDVIYNDEWQYYKMKANDIKERKEPTELLFKENPVILYNSQIVGNNAPFHTIISYIDALDYLMSGNSNELQKLFDAVLVLGKKIKDEDKDSMDEWKFIDGMKKEDRAEFLEKTNDPAFRQYISGLLINEIHKHGHVIDWYAPDTGLTGEVSAKAMRTRLFDMDMNSQKVEKIYKEGAEKRIRLINQILELKSNVKTGEVNIIYNRTVPSEIEDKLTALNGITFISDRTKLELSGIDYEQEKKRIDEEFDGIEVEDDSVDKVEK